MSIFSFKKSEKFTRPWGDFYYIDESETRRFVETYFADQNITNFDNISPKILVVKPEMRLSWQYHNRREEVWKVVEGPVGVIRSNNDEQGDVIIHNKNDLIVLDKQERHRLVGLSNMAIVAELWKHTDLLNPSNEEDIIRIEDDFVR